jgi:hypothetical protein
VSLLVSSSTQPGAPGRAPLSQNGPQVHRVIHVAPVGHLSPQHGHLGCSLRLPASEGTRVPETTGFADCVTKTRLRTTIHDGSPA